MSDSELNLSRMDSSGSGSGDDYTPEPPVPRKKAAKTAKKAAKGRGKPRGRGRARGSQSREEHLHRDDIERMERLREQAIEDQRARIQSLSLAGAQDILMRALEREPSLFFDLPDLPHSHDTPSQDPPVQRPPSWCVCQRCRDMPTLLEQKCCREQPLSCVSLLPQFDMYVMPEGHLRLARRIYNDVRASVDRPEPGEDNRQFRFAAYRQFIVWRFPSANYRIVIPSCVVWKIRDRWPDPNNQYIGFIPRRI